MAITREDTELGLTRGALVQTAVELFRVYRAHQAGEAFEVLSPELIAAYERVARAAETFTDLDLIRMRKV